MSNIPNELERKAVIEAVLNLFGASKTESLMLPIPGTNPQLWIAAGELEEIRALAAMTNDNKQPDVPAARSEACDKICKMVVDYIEDYEYDDGEACHSPSELERILIADAINGLLGMQEFIPLLLAWQSQCPVWNEYAAPTPPSAPVQQSGREAIAGIDLDAMVSRFLGWKLPDDFYPDAGISFAPSELQKSGVHTWPTGTNLLHAGQARAMLEYVMAANSPQSVDAEREGFEKWWKEEQQGTWPECFNADQKESARVAWLARSALSTSPLLDKNDQAEGENSYYRAEFERECKDGDALLEIIGIYQAGRTDGGSINIGKVREHQRQTIETLMQLIRDKDARIAELSKSHQPDSNELVEKALGEALKRMDRARNILTNGNPTPECNWGMLDTADIRTALSTSPLLNKNREG